MTTNLFYSKFAFNLLEVDNGQVYVCVYILISLQFSCLVKLWWLILKPLLAPTLFVRCLLHLEIDRVSGYFLSLSLPLSLFDYSTVCICHSFLCSMLLSHHYNNVQSRSVLITRTHTHTLGPFVWKIIFLTTQRLD